LDEKRSLLLQVPAMTKMTGGDAPPPEVPVTDYAVHKRVPA
jgi:hypothetical protein